VRPGKYPGSMSPALSVISSLYGKARIATYICFSFLKIKKNKGERDD